MDGSQKNKSFIQTVSMASSRVILNSLSVHQIKEAGSKVRLGAILVALALLSRPVFWLGTKA